MPSELADISARISCHLHHGREVTTTLVKEYLNKSRLVHLASHGQWNREAPVRSGIVVSSPDGDRFETLSGVEIERDCAVSAELVVLSACQSVSDDRSGEGLFGLSQSIRRAGARCVVGSQAKVDDASTLSFMRAFYSELSRGSQVGSSLMRARRSMAADPNVDPRFWGYFVSVGDGSCSPLS